MKPIIDSHLDLAWNALSYNRDLTWPLQELRRHESGMTDHPCRAHATITLPEMRKARIAVCVATILARGGPDQKRQSGYSRTDLDHATQAIAHAVGHGQLAYYRLLEDEKRLRQIRTAADLAAHWKAWLADEEGTPIGYILSMEGADPITTPGQLERWWDVGLRALGLAHYGKSHYAVGTGDSGPLTTLGFEMLREMDRLGMILDLTHCSDPSFFQAIDTFRGRVLASHQNCRALVPGDRQFSDEQIRLVIERDGILGVPYDAWMMYPGWRKGETSPEVVAIEASADHIDHVCQMAGNARHSAIGSDLDGGFGTEQTPRDLDTIADLQNLAGILAGRGYKDADIDLIFHGNWLRFFGEALPGGSRTRA